MITYLYIKTHNQTGLKYFGKTVSEKTKTKISNSMKGKPSNRTGKKNTSVHCKKLQMRILVQNGGITALI